ncbi:C39 family peptidase [Candidatus Roizmanbacteria bacterium]|nr:C39 family peptidase [Candidatus Roizmanbacteria bacterium]
MRAVSSSYSFLIILLLFLVSPIFHIPLLSLECKPGFTYQNQEELEQIKSLCEQKVGDLRSKANTLSSQIQFMDTQIYLTTLKIQVTEQKIVDTQKEIEVLTQKIDNLDNSLNRLSKILLERIVEGYKTHPISLLNLFLDSDNANDFLNKVKYQKTTQDNNQKLLIQVQESKLNFEEQKKVREDKKAELAALNETLNNQKLSLNNQKADKQRLLEVTRSDEDTFQRLLDGAQKQLSAFKSFVQSAGGGTIAANGFGSGSDGWYYSQRDERWAGKTMGYSSDTVLEVGCLITDIAMVMKKYGIDMTPLTIAANANYFFSNTAYMLHPSSFSWPNGLSYVNIAVSAIDEEIKNGRPVIVGLYAGKYGTHYVVLKQIEGSDYIMHDPYYGPDKKFSDHYSKGSIFVAAVFK